MQAEQTLIGRVVSVAGSEVIFLHEAPPNANGGDSEPGSLQIGSLVKMQNPESTVFGMVSGLSIPVPGAKGEQGEMKIVELELLGEAPRNGAANGHSSNGHGGNGQANGAAAEAAVESSGEAEEPAGANGANGALAPLNGKGGFQRGVSIFPSLGDKVFATDQQDLSVVYARPEASTVKIGTIHQDSGLPAYILTDDLLGRHFAVLGTTGSGKSCAVALILRGILQRHGNAHIVLLDPHNEYWRTFGDAAEVLSPENLQLPYWLLNFEEIVEVVLGNESRDVSASVAILHDGIASAKRQFLKSDDDEISITVDTPLPYRLTDLIQHVDDEMGKLDKPEDTAPYHKVKNRLNALRADKRFAFMFGGLSVRDNMSEILSRILRIPVDGKPVTIMDLSGVPSEILNVVVSVLCRITFDFGLWSERAVPILLVCEEAHRYAPQNTEAGFEPTKRALSRIAKEGRKYGVSLCVVSQRPSELATDMLSQCNTIFAMRLSNENDQDFVRAAMSDNAIGIIDFLPSLHNGEAIAVGEGVPVPVRLSFEELPEEHRPQSGTASFSSAWQKESQDKEFLNEVISRWRRQRR